MEEGGNDPILISYQHQGICGKRIALETDIWVLVCLCWCQVVAHIHLQAPLVINIEGFVGTKGFTGYYLQK
jgi:hypothetical protein